MADHPAVLWAAMRRRAARTRRPEEATAKAARISPGTAVGCLRSSCMSERNRDSGTSDSQWNGTATAGA